MQWGLKFGSDIETLQNVYEESGIKPAALRDQPKLTAQEAYYLSAFNRLSGSRRPGDFVSPIPQSEYLAFYVASGIDDYDERETLERYVHALDNHYIDYCSKKMKAEREKRQ